jgi:quercetin dioxygenase-like cupin family protein
MLLRCVFIVGLLGTTSAHAQDVMQYGLAHIKVVAENDKVRVLKFTPRAGDKTPIHSHPASMIYVLKGGKVRTTLADGTTTTTELKTGDTVLRDPVTHSDEALDAVELLLVELKK